MEVVAKLRQGDPMSTSLAGQFATLAVGTTRSQSGAAFSWPGICLLIAGTGGSIASENLDQIPLWGTSTIIESRPTHSSAIDFRTARDHVGNIRGTLKLNVTEMAVLFDVTRPTIYSWFRGQEPKASVLKKITSISRVADRLKALGIQRIELYIRRPIVDGTSLIDLLKSGRPVSEVIAAIESIAAKEASVRKLASSRRVGAPKFNYDELDSLSSPITQERA